MLPEDAPPGHEAHTAVRWDNNNKWPLAHFTFGPSKIRFQTTIGQAGSRDVAMRLARVCFMQFASGMAFEEVKQFRQDWYARIKEVRSGKPARPAKKLKVGDEQPNGAAVADDATPQEAADGAAPAGNGHARQDSGLAALAALPPGAELQDVPSDSIAHRAVKHDRSKDIYWFKVPENAGLGKFTVGVSRAGTGEEAARIARLCYVKMLAGSTREEVTHYREHLYTSGPPKPRPAGGSASAEEGAGVGEVDCKACRGRHRPHTCGLFGEAAAGPDGAGAPTPAAAPAATGPPSAAPTAGPAAAATGTGPSWWKGSIADVTPDQDQEFSKWVGLSRGKFNEQDMPWTAYERLVASKQHAPFWRAKVIELGLATEPETEHFTRSDSVERLYRGWLVHAGQAGQPSREEAAAPGASAAAAASASAREGKVSKKEKKASREKEKAEREAEAAAALPDVGGAPVRYKTNGRQGKGLFWFEYIRSDGTRERFQTTVLAAGGHEAAQKIAAQCYEKFVSGATRAEVEEYRAGLYAAAGGGGDGAAATSEPAAKRQRTAAAEPDSEEAILATLRADGRLQGAVRMEGREESRRNASINGIYAPCKGGFEGRPAFEKADASQSSRFIFYSAKKKRWKINEHLDDSGGGFAYAKAKDDGKGGPGPSLTWHVFDGGSKGYNEDPAVRCVLLEGSAAEPSKPPAQAKVDSRRTQGDSVGKVPSAGQTAAPAATAATAKPSGGSDSGSASDSEASDDSVGSDSSSSSGSEAGGKKPGKGAKAPNLAVRPPGAGPAGSPPPPSARIPDASPGARPADRTPPPSTTQRRACAKMLVRSGLRCQCHFAYRWMCPAQKVSGAK